MAQLTSWGDAPFLVTKSCGAVETVTVGGRDRWALECLMAAGKTGCTPIDTPGPRWSGYVFNLRHMGIEIETIHERHAGPFSGTHGRYVLRSKVTCVFRSIRPLIPTTCAHLFRSIRPPVTRCREAVEFGYQV